MNGQTVLHQWGLVEPFLRHQNALTNSAFEASKLACVETPLLQHDCRRAGNTRNESQTTQPIFVCVRACSIFWEGLHAHTHTYTHIPSLTKLYTCLEVLQLTQGLQSSQNNAQICDRNKLQNCFERGRCPFGADGVQVKFLIFSATCSYLLLNKGLKEENEEKRIKKQTSGEKKKEDSLQPPSHRPNPSKSVN